MLVAIADLLTRTTQPLTIVLCEDAFHLRLQRRFKIPQNPLFRLILNRQPINLTHPGDQVQQHEGVSETLWVGSA